MMWSCVLNSMILHRNTVSIGFHPWHMPSFPVSSRIPSWSQHGTHQFTKEGLSGWLDFNEAQWIINDHHHHHHCQDDYIFQYHGLYLNGISQQKWWKGHQQENTVKCAYILDLLFGVFSLALMWVLQCVYPVSYTHLTLPTTPYV